MSARLRSLVGPKAQIEIDLLASRWKFSNLNRVQGNVIITPVNDVPFDVIDVDFIGASRTWVERLTTAAAVSGRTYASHTFLRLSQPGVAESLPADRILRAKQAYKIPFFFVIPNQLLPRVCNHAVNNESLRDAHTQLPPTLGDDNADERKAGRYFDDLSPEMACIRYGVYVKIWKDKPDGERVCTMGKGKKVHVVPASDELPPLNIEDDENNDYTLRKEKKLKKGLLKGKLGTLVMQAQQPPSLKLPAPDLDSDERVTTMATVLLRFDPTEENLQPPRLNNLTTKLKATTFFASTPRRDFPSRQDPLNEMNNGAHNVTLDLSSRCMANVDWIRMPDSRATTPVRSARRDSSTALSAPFVPPKPSSTYKTGAYYVARLLVPIELPTGKSWIPTFHSCLVSRTYTLALSLSTNITSLAGNLDLRLPIQLSASSSNTPNSPRPSITTLQGVEVEPEEGEMAGVDEFFEPRAIRPPQDEYLGGSTLVGRPVDVTNSSTPAVANPTASQPALPEYSYFAPGTRRGRVGVPAF